jgi:hypothetical protein
MTVRVIFDLWRGGTAQAEVPLEAVQLLRRISDSFLEVEVDGKRGVVVDQQSVFALTAA